MCLLILVYFGVVLTIANFSYVETFRLNDHRLNLVVKTSCVVFCVAGFTCSNLEFSAHCITHFVVTIKTSIAALQLITVTQGGLKTMIVYLFAVFISSNPVLKLGSFQQERITAD